MYKEENDNKLQILGKLAASLAHEIRNPLSAIKLNLEFVKMSEINDDVRDSIDSCIEATQRIQSLIENTLDFSRSSINDFTPQSINIVVSSAVEIMVSRGKVFNIVITEQLDHTLPPVSFNKNKMLQVLLNLITNAFEAIEKNGLVKIKTYREVINENQYVTLEIEDSGKGISEDNKAKIFNDFFTNKEYGTGLGLSVCKMILDEFNASIDFVSHVGRGSRFYVRFNQNVSCVVK
ncbi:MAG: ATP-binding protein [Ignavibacteria bacterium]